MKNPVLDATWILEDSPSDNASGADNQQERLDVEQIPPEIGSFLSGFALGEGSFMIVCRPRADYRRGWKVSAAFNVSQSDVVPLELFQKQLRCGTIRKAGNDGWYLEVNNLRDIAGAVIPFFPQVSPGWTQGCRLRHIRSGGPHPAEGVTAQRR